MSSSSQDEPQLAGLPLRGGDLSQGVHVKFGIVTVSDRASTGVYEDKSGPAILQFFHEAIASGCVGAGAVMAGVPTYLFV